MPKPSYTWDEVAKHSTPGDVWVSVSSKVYDVSSFVESHPGGRAQLLIGAGRDVTQVFGMYHKAETTKLLEKFYIGELHTPELPSFPPTSQFSQVLNERVKQHFVETKKDPKVAPWMFFRYAVIITVLLTSFFFSMVYAETSIISVPLSIIVGVACALIGLMPLHDASHFAVTHNPVVWRCVGSIHDFLNGASLLVWLYQHTMGHHPYTNIDHADPDIMTAAQDVPDIRRIKPTQSWFWRYLQQHVYVPIIYGLLSIKTRIQDVLVLTVLKKNGSVRVNEPTTLDWILFIAGKLFFLSYRLIIPMFFVSPLRVLSLFAVSDLISSYYLALSFQCSHVVGEVQWPLPDANNHISLDWHAMQVLTTLDYATDSWICTVLTGALNHQTAHHLFPGVSQYYYPEVTPIVVKTCKEFGIQYNYKPTFLEALMAHINHLRAMGADPKST